MKTTSRIVAVIAALASVAAVACGAPPDGGEGTGATSEAIANCPPGSTTCNPFPGSSSSGGGTGSSSGGRPLCKAETVNVNLSLAAGAANTYPLYELSEMSGLCTQGNDASYATVGAVINDLETMVQPDYYLSCVLYALYASGACTNTPLRTNVNLAVMEPNGQASTSTHWLDEITCTTADPKTIVGNCASTYGAYGDGLPLEFFAVGSGWGVAFDPVGSCSGCRNPTIVQAQAQ